MDHHVIQFTVDMTVDAHLRNDKYVSSIKEIIRELKRHAGNTSSSRSNYPILPLQDDGNPLFFEVRLNAQPTRLTLRFRRDNLYLVGFRIGHGQGQITYTFDAAYLPGMPMGFTHEYDRMICTARYNVPEPGSGNTGLMRVNLGRKALMDAVGWATDTYAGDQQAKTMRRARAALAFCVMFSEAARFVPVLEYVKTKWVQTDDNTPNLMPQWMDVLVKRWRELSLLVVRYDANLKRNPKDTICYKWVPPQLRIEKRVLESIDKSVTKRKVWEPKHGDDKTKIMMGSDDNTIIFWALTAEELSRYLSVLLRGSATIQDLRDNPR